jgi:hypothetical protein
VLPLLLASNEQRAAFPEGLNPRPRGAAAATAAAAAGFVCSGRDLTRVKRGREDQIVEPGSDRTTGEVGEVGEVAVAEPGAEKGFLVRLRLSIEHHLPNLAGTGKGFLAWLHTKTVAPRSQARLFACSLFEAIACRCEITVCIVSRRVLHRTVGTFGLQATAAGARSRFT